MVMDSNSDAPNGPQLPEKSRRLERLRPSGGYRRLRSFRVATIIYDATVAFCEKFVDKKSRTHDQMVQAARSGRQNIAEGSRASATSSQTELRLINVARASLDELLLDYEDFLRQRSLRQWRKQDPDAQAVRALGTSRPAPSAAPIRPILTTHTAPPTRPPPRARSAPPAETDQSDQSDQSDPSDPSDPSGRELYAPWL